MSKDQCVILKGPCICWHPGDIGLLRGQSAVCLSLEQAWILGFDLFSLSAMLPLTSAPVPLPNPLMTL